MICIDQASLDFFHGESLQSVIEKLLFMFTNHILENNRLMVSGVVHRYLKPLNLVLSEDSGSFKLIDLGACVDIRSGFNYVWSRLFLFNIRLLNLFLQKDSAIQHPSAKLLCDQANMMYCTFYFVVLKYF